MLDSLKQFFDKITKSEAAGEQADHDILVAVCALLVEMARIDDAFAPAEMEIILEVLEEKYGLSRDHGTALIKEAEKELDQSVDLWQFANLINENYSIPKKLELIETLWRLVYVDAQMNKYEHYLMDKLAKILRVTHEQLIEAKLKVLHPAK